jgi:hypothetical protein
VTATAPPQQTGRYQRGECTQRRTPDQFRHYHETFYALCIGCGHPVKKTSMGFYDNRLICDDCAKKESV